MIGNASGFIAIGTLVRYNCRILLLKNVHISNGGDPVALHYITEKLRMVTTWGIPTDKPTGDIILTGQITDCDTMGASVGALIKVLLYRNNLLHRVLGYTYSGSDGWYMFPIDRSLVMPDDKIHIQIVGTPPGYRTPCKG
jgi:hypothetical protein